MVRCARLFQRGLALHPTQTPLDPGTPRVPAILFLLLLVLLLLLLLVHVPLLL
eukprot:COSAG05_NODE_18830_length_302_cov_0.758621_1_plen_52_part_10